MTVKEPTILTNLQRGNVKQESPMLLHQRTLHELAAQGEIYNVNPQMVDLLDASNMTPLLWAAGYGQTSTVEFLLRSGAYPNHRCSGGKTALMFAAAKGYIHTVKALISDGADVNICDESGNSAVMYAARQDQAAVIQELIKRGAQLGHANAYGQTAYSIAILNKNKSAQALIESHLVNVIRESLKSSS